jgi:hypothetical protein
MKGHPPTSDVPFEVAFVNHNEIGKVWATPVHFSRRFTKRGFESLWEETRRLLVESLSAKWDEDCCGRADFAVGDEWGDSWTQCGGIYSARICCPDFVTVVSRALANTQHKEKWAFNVAVEVWDGDERTKLGLPFHCGQLVIKAGFLFVPLDGFDYSMFYPHHYNSA